MTTTSDHGWRRLIATVSAVLLLGVLTGTDVSAQRSDDPATDPIESGRSAIESLGPDLAAVAEANGLTSDQLRSDFAADDTLSVDEQGELLYVDTPAPRETTLSLEGPARPSGATEAGPPTTDPVFFLHSRPGADHTVYLDFDGHTTSGTTWNTAYGVDPIVSPPYNISGSAATWSASEIARIDAVWNRVVEDFSPFDLDVTTEEPPVGDLRKSGSGDTRWGVRVVITDDTFANCGCGGHAYIGAFDDPTDEPAFVYNSSLSGAAEASSHEAGHTMLLAHDGTNGGPTYYGGHGSGATGWAPLMGASYSRSVTQWSKGDYFNANNNTSSANYGNGADDLAVLSSLTNGNGFGYRPDDHGNTTGSATVLSGPTLSASGVIERTTDVDVFSFTTAAGPVTIDLDPWAGLANLDITARLLNSSGTPIATSNPAGALDASFSTTLPAGTYHVTVDGTGVGSPLANPPSGYSEHASIGQYTLTGTIIPPAAGGSINGTVTEDGTGDPVEGILVAAIGPFPDFAELDGSAVTDAAGNYSIEGLGTGDHLMAFLDLALAHAPEFHDNTTDPTAGTVVTAVSGGLTVDASLPPVTAPATGSTTLTGTVTETGTGSPIGGAMVAAVGPSGIDGITIADASGSYVIDLEPGDYAVEFLDLTGDHLGEWYDDVRIFDLPNAGLVTVGPDGLVVDADLDPY